MFNLYICQFCESIVRTRTGNNTVPVCFDCHDYKGLHFVGTSVVVDCNCQLPMCPECDSDFWVDESWEYDRAFLPEPLPEPPF